MFIKLLVLSFSMSCFSTMLLAQSSWMEWDANVSGTEDLEGWREKYEDLSEIAEHPFNINAITKEQLEQLPFLSDKLIENILYYMYKYGPMFHENELLGVEGMDWQTRRFLQDFIYIGPYEGGRRRLRMKDLAKYNKQELLVRFDAPLNQKAGYARYDESVLSESPNKQYYGSPYYHNLRYRFRFQDRLFFGLTAEKDAGEPFFCKYNRKGYDFYSACLFLKDFGRLKALALGHYKASFGYGLVINAGDFNMGKSGTVASMGRFGSGFARYASTGESNFLQGVAATWQIAGRWFLSGFYSFRKMDARVEDMFIRSFKTDGYHRLKKDMEKKNKVDNHLVGSDLSFNGKFVEFGLTSVYNVFNKLLNPDLRPYNVFYPRGKSFFNIGAHYKVFLSRFVLSGETAFDKNGRVATLNMLSYSPSVNTTLLFINRYYDKRYQAIYADAFGENSRMQNEAGSYIGLETSFLGKFRLLCYGDFFHFFYRRYQVDKDHTSGADGLFQLSYSPFNSLSMLIKYSCKDKAKNFTSGSGEKYVLPYVRQRLHYQLSYAPYQHLSLKTEAEYVRASHGKRESSDGVLVGGSVKAGIPSFPLQAQLSGAWFRTGDYDSRIYMYEPGLLYAFSMTSFYGKGGRLAVNLKYSWKDRLVLQAKWGWTHYADRTRIGSGAEEIQGSGKADLQFQLKVKW